MNHKIRYICIQRARATKGKINPVDLCKNENSLVCLKHWYFSQWIPADSGSVVTTDVYGVLRWFFVYHVFGSRVGAKDILTMIGVQKCIFLLNQKIEQMVMPDFHESNY